MTFNFSTLNAERTPPHAPTTTSRTLLWPAVTCLLSPLPFSISSAAPLPTFPPFAPFRPVTVGKYANWVLMQIYSLRQWQQFGRSNNNNNNCQNKKPTQYFGHQCGQQQRGGGRGRIIPILNENWHWNYFNFHSFDCDFLQLQLQLLLLLLLQLSARRVIKAWII